MWVNHESELLKYKINGQLNKPYEFEAMLALGTGGHDRFWRQLLFVDSASESALGTGRSTFLPRSLVLSGQSRLEPTAILLEKRPSIGG